MITFDVWDGDRQVTTVNSIPQAILLAQRGPYLVTERVPLGDARLLMVEDLSEGCLGSLSRSDLEDLEKDGQLLDVITDAAERAAREARTFDFDRGSTTICDAVPTPD